MTNKPTDYYQGRRRRQTAMSLSSVELAMGADKSDEYKRVIAKPGYF